MKGSPGRIVLSTASFCLALPALTTANQVDVRGNWQLNIDCGLAATATAVVSLDEALPGGATTAEVVGCGTLEVPNAIRRPASCTITPSPLAGSVSGAAFELPATGFWASDAAFSPPLPFFTCSGAARVLSAHHLSGNVVDDGGGRATRISGVWRNGPFEFRDPEGAVCYALEAPPGCSFDMRRNDVAVGTDVTVSPRERTTVTFAEVTAPGTLTLMPLTDADAAVPVHFQVLGSGTLPLFYDVHTTATFAGTVTSCFPYPDEDRDGAVDGTDPPLDETEIKVLHEEGGVFVDRTLSLDTTEKVVCAATESLSQLAVARGRAQGRHDHPSNGGAVVLRRLRSGGVHLGFSSVWTTYPEPWETGDPDDPRLAGAVVEIFSATQSPAARFELPAERWRARRHGQRFRSRGQWGSDVTPVAGRAVLDRRLQWIRIDATAQSLPFDDLRQGIGVRVTIGSWRHCAVATTYRAGGRPNLLQGWNAPGRPVDCADKRMRAALAR